MSGLVSVAIAAFNGERFIAETIRSVLGQTYRPLETIVCDDGSTDGTRDILRAFEPDVRVLEKSNEGVSAARNDAVRIARGDYLAFVDQDDIWEPDLIERQVRRLSASPGLGLVYADSWIIDETGEIRGQRRNYLRYRSGNVFQDLLRGNFIPIETMVMPRRVFDAAGGFDPSLHYLEDFDLCLKIAHRHPVDFDPEPLARYRIHGRNLSYDMESICIEWGRILHSIESRFPGVDAPTLALANRERRRRLAEGAWHAYRRCDFSLGDSLANQASPIRPASLAAKIAIGSTLLRCLPRKFAVPLGPFLARRTRYGVPRAP